MPHPLFLFIICLQLILPSTLLHMTLNIQAIVWVQALSEFAVTCWSNFQKVYGHVSDHNIIICNNIMAQLYDGMQQLIMGLTFKILRNSPHSTPRSIVHMGFAMALKSWENVNLHFESSLHVSLSHQKQLYYDNACKQHVYALNHEPQLYKNSRFFVDRFHWRGHVGCSKGYILDSYKMLDSARINSQVNEQANSGLQRIKGQLAYMKPCFHVISLFRTWTKLRN